MAWTTPMTWVANTPLTAAQLNQQLRDNMNETAPAKATQQGSIFVGNGQNSIVERSIVAHSVSTSQTTTSVSFADLATTGPTVTVTTGTSALVFLSANLKNATANEAAIAGVEVTGASSIAASDTNSLLVRAGAADEIQATKTVRLSTLTPGSNTFTMKYRVTAGTATFLRRDMFVLPL